LDWEEYSHFSMICRLQAGASGLPFMPMKGTGAPDLLHHNLKFQTVADPYRGEKVVVVPPLKPDLAIVHVQRADVEGNAHVWGILGEQRLAAFAAEHVIVTAEEIVDERVIRSDPNRTLIPGMVVDAVCHVPYCAHPSYTQGYHDRDNEFYLAWDKISQTEAGVQAYLEEWVYGLPDRAAYWEKLGPDVHQRLRAGQRISEPINYGAY
jgi:glutaconate CoA-transferase subunit A